jgi:putative flippase GtrA
MRAKSCPHNALRDMRVRQIKPEWWQHIGANEVKPEADGINAREREDLMQSRLANSNLDNGMQTLAARPINLDSYNALALNDLRGFEGPVVDIKVEKNGKRLIAPSTLVRWCKFNVVGGIGILVQFAALFLLKSILHFNYLAATAIAVEAAVVHNFVWHEQFTWADRVQPSWSRSLPRLLRFNLTNGAVSILGNLALMRVMVGQGHMNYLLANAIAITLCSLANFLVSQTWVFEERS